MEEGPGEEVSKHRLELLVGADRALLDHLIDDVFPFRLRPPLRHDPVRIVAVAAHPGK